MEGYDAWQLKPKEALSKTPFWLTQEDFPNIYLETQDYVN